MTSVERSATLVLRLSAVRDAANSWLQEEAMTPQDLTLIESDTGEVRDVADEFASSFYSVLFELEPTAEQLFGEDMATQRRKLMTELVVLIELGTAASRDGLDELDRRGRDLGRRHVGYGVTTEHYEVVGIALLSALRDHVSNWDEAHEQAWVRLYTLVASVMQSADERDSS